MRDLGQDVKYGLRMLWKSPGFTVVAVLTLALGIGANTTIFTIVNAVFLNPLPVEDAPTLVNLYTTDSRTSLAQLTMLPVSYQNFHDYQAEAPGFEGLTAVSFAPVSLSGEGEPRQLAALLVSANYFDVLGVPPVLGRGFLPEEDKRGAGSPVVVISHRLWAEQFGGEPDIIGRTVSLNSRAFTVIGVAPQGFKGTNTFGNPDLLWIPLESWRLVLTGPVAQYFDGRRGLFLNAFGRLSEGTSRRQAEAGLQTVASRLEQEYPDDNQGRTITLVPMAEAAVGINQRGQFLRAGGVLMIAVGLVLLIACVNLANLLLARSANREREMGIRAAIGADRRRLIRQLLIESLLLAGIGGLAGLGLAWWGRNALWALRPPFFGANAIDLSLDGRVLLFTLGIAMLTGVLFGLAPAIKSSDPDLTETLKVGGRSGAGSWGRSRMRRLLVISEVALALVALVAAGLFVRSMQEAQRIDPGFERERLFVMTYDLGTRQYDVERGRQVHEEMLQRASGVPGVEAVAVSANGPLAGGFFRTVIPEGRQVEPGQGTVMALSNPVSPDYFRAVGIPLRRGRAFNDFDRSDGPRVAVVNEAMGKRFWPGEDPIGKRFTFFGEEEAHEIVGMVGDSSILQIGGDPQPVAYVSLSQSFTPVGVIHVRTEGDPNAVLPTVRARLQEIDRELAFTNVNTIGQILDQALWAPRMGAGLLGLFGGLALLLAGIGIFGVMSYTVSERTQEIGLRMALGARPGAIHSMVLGQGMVLALWGIGIGLVASFAISRFASSLLFGIPATDLPTYLAIPGLLALVAAAACYLPARRATRVDPLIALREE